VRGALRSSERRRRGEKPTDDFCDRFRGLSDDDAEVVATAVDVLAVPERDSAKAVRARAASGPAKQANDSA
jgi:hypothetical protein